MVFLAKMGFVPRVDLRCWFKVRDAVEGMLIIRFRVRVYGFGAEGYGNWVALDRNCREVQ